MQGNTMMGHGGTDRKKNGRHADRCTIAVGIALLCCPAAGRAAEWSVGPAVAVLLGYESNPALTTTSQKGTSEGIIAPSVSVRRLTETSGVDLGILARGTYYTTNEYQDTSEGQLSLSSFLQSTERTRLGLGAISRWDSLFESAVLGSGTGNIQDVDIGLVNTKVRREWIAVTPSVSYAVTERSAVSLQYRLTDVQFGDVGTTGLVDYVQHYLSGTYSYKLTPANSLDLVLVGSQYHPAGGVETNTLQMLGGISHAFSTTASAALRAGLGKARDNFPDGSQIATSIFVLEARGLQKSELSTLEAVLSRDVQPSGSGQAVESDQLRLNWTRRLSETRALVLRSTVFRNKSLRDANPTGDRLYGEAIAGVNWTVAPDWSLGLMYQYRYQKYDVARNSASSNGIFLAFTWALPRPH